MNSIPPGHSFRTSEAAGHFREREKEAQRCLLRPAEADPTCPPGSEPDAWPPATSPVPLPLPHSVPPCSPMQRCVCRGWGGSTWRSCSRGLELPQENQLRTSLPVQWLRLWASTAGGTGSIPGWGTKIPHATWPKKKKRRPPGRLPGGAGEEGRCKGPHQGAHFLLRPETYSRPNLAPGFTNSTKGPLPTKDS